MNSTSQIHPVPRRIDEPAQQPYTDAFDRYLIERGYARNTVRAYLGYASHFLRWTQRSGARSTQGRRDGRRAVSR